MRSSTAQQGLSPPNFFWVFSESGPIDCLPSNLNVLVSAGVAWENSSADKFGTVWTPRSPDNVFIDSGGYQAVSRWGGEYPYSPTELFEYASQMGAEYVATMDLVCDPNVESDLSSTERIEQTVENTTEVVAAYEASSTNYDFQLVPVIQGWKPREYLECVDAFRDRGLIREYMGIGSVARKHANDEIHEILTRLNNNLPSTDFHLFGAKLSIVRDHRFWGQFESCDSAAWRFRPSELGRDKMYAESKHEKTKFFYTYKQKINHAKSQMQAQTTLF
ncbi:DUF7221 family queuine tRNA-ribosyltransferase-like protein [Salinibaculum rarum]|uniref:deazapurine DNA modification protein DpdA family protein n=1 Tax=Salinibaculum rarum TaxID=3058903 RepID=UPI00265FB8B0|nr:hypothetical protein [Salinibaculum sp. KK48]